MSFRQKLLSLVNDFLLAITSGTLDSFLESFANLMKEVKDKAEEDSLSTDDRNLAFTVAGAIQDIGSAWDRMQLDCEKSHVELEERVNSQISRHFFSGHCSAPLTSSFPPNVSPFLSCSPILTCHQFFVFDQDHAQEDLDQRRLWRRKRDGCVILHGESRLLIIFTSDYVLDRFISLTYQTRRSRETTETTAVVSFILYFHLSLGLSTSKARVVALERGVDVQQAEEDGRWEL